MSAPRKIYTVALTGGIGSGKSAVAAYLSRNGVMVYDSDSRTKMLYDNDIDLLSEIREVFGERIFRRDGKLDRKALAAMIFSSSDALSRLEEIVHPAVIRDFLEWKSGFSPENWGGYCGQPPFVVIESAIILEKPLFRDVYDASVAVDAPLLTRIARAAARDGVPEERIMERIASQNTDTSLADAVIVNDSDLETLEKRTDIAFKLLPLKD